MHKMVIRHKLLQGFTLVEVAIVLIIVGLMMSAFLMPLAAQLDSKSYRETRAKLEDIKEAIIGFALSHTALDGKPYLPCPDTDGDGAENRSAFGGGCSGYEGNLPSQELGMLMTDSWNNNYIYRVSPSFANKSAGFTLGSTGNITVLNASGGSNVVTSIPVLILSKGKNGGVAAVNADEVENANGTNSIFVSHEFTPTFDDEVSWISANILFNRMVTAGKLP
jgi:prepilin-type N-terminal cleavage/methylation domain-containing protein